MSKFAERMQAEKFGLDKPDPYKPKPPEEPKPRGVLTIDEVMELVSEIAQNGEGADRFRALKMLASSTTSAITLPSPLAGNELRARLARLMKSAGRDECQAAFHLAYPAAKKRIEESRLITEDHVDPDILLRARSIVSLKMFYREFPEIKRHGFPSGYPVGRGLELQREWLRRKAVQMLVDRVKTAVQKQQEEREAFDRMVSEDKDAPGTKQQGSQAQEDLGRTTDPAVSL